MLTKRYRLRRKYDFKVTYSRGKSLVHPMMVLYVRRKKDDARTNIRIGFSVSKKLGGAVVRNRIKRRLREAFRTHVPALTGSADLIIVGRTKLKSSDYASQIVALGTLLNQANLLVSPGKSVAGENHCAESEGPS